MAKKGKRGGKKKHKKGGLESAMSAGFKRGFGGGKSKSKKSNKRPLKLLKWAASKMRSNLPKLEAIIERRQAAGER